MDEQRVIQLLKSQEQMINHLLGLYLDEVGRSKDLVKRLRLVEEGNNHLQGQNRRAVDICRSWKECHDERVIQVESLQAKVEILEKMSKSQNHELERLRRKEDVEVEVEKQRAAAIAYINSNPIPYKITFKKK